MEHARTPMELRLRRRPGAILIEVADEDGRLARPTPTGLSDERHRGLVIVQTLSARWGVRPTGGGKVVWAQVANPYEDAAELEAEPRGDEAGIGVDVVDLEAAVAAFPDLVPFEQEPPIGTGPAAEPELEPESEHEDDADEDSQNSVEPTGSSGRSSSRTRRSMTAR